MNRPNLLFIMADQHRFDYIGCASADHVRTPNLDRLAAGGVRFTRCFTNSPLCAPARIGLATGLDPHRTGGLDNSSFLAPELTTYYQRLRDHGYRVGCVGKLDLAKPDVYNGRRGDRPCLYAWGFTHPVEVEGKQHSLSSETSRGPYGHWLRDQGLYKAYLDERIALRKVKHSQWHTPSALPAETFLDVYQGRRAVEWLQDITTDFPWHLFVSFSGPHVPHDPPKEYFDRYADARMPRPVPEPEGLPVFRGAAGYASLAEDPDRMQDVRRAYCAYIELIDEQIGAILETLEKRGMADNTLVVFSADHGEMLGDLGLFSKSLPYEPSIRVPLIVSGPGVARGETCDALVELSDLNPTLCRAGGLPDQAGLDARAFNDCLVDPGARHRDSVVSSLRSFQCCRDARYKFVMNHNADAELYDLEQDPNEQRNLGADPTPEARETMMRLRGEIDHRNEQSPHGPPR